MHSECTSTYRFIETKRRSSFWPFLKRLKPSLRIDVRRETEPITAAPAALVLLLICTFQMNSVDLYPTHTK